MAKAGDIKVVYDGHSKFMDAMKALNTVDVKVGIPFGTPPHQDEDGDVTGVTNAALGYINENGSDLQNIPPRPFLIPGVKRVQSLIAEEFKKMAQECFSDTRAVYKRMNRAGIIAMNSVKEVLGSYPDYTEGDASYARRKAAGFKGMKPLIESGQMRNSITYVVEDGSK